MKVCYAKSSLTTLKAWHKLINSTFVRLSNYHYKYKDSNKYHMHINPVEVLRF